jgi:hypothetical protein
MINSYSNCGIFYSYEKSVLTLAKTVDGIIVLESLVFKNSSLNLVVGDFKKLNIPVSKTRSNSSHGLKMLISPKLIQIDFTNELELRDCIDLFKSLSNEKRLNMSLVTKNRDSDIRSVYACLMSINLREIFGDYKLRADLGTVKKTKTRNFGRWV